MHLHGEIAERILGVEQPVTRAASKRGLMDAIHARIATLERAGKTWLYPGAIHGNQIHHG